MINEYWYKNALVYQDLWLETRYFWFADCYPGRKEYEPDTILGPFRTKEEAEEAVSKAP